MQTTRPQVIRSVDSLVREFWGKGVDAMHASLSVGLTELPGAQGPGERTHCCCILYSEARIGNLEQVILEYLAREIA